MIVDKVMLLHPTSVDAGRLPVTLGWPVKPATNVSREAAIRVDMGGRGGRFIMLRRWRYPIVPLSHQLSVRTCVDGEYKLRETRTCFATGQANAKRKERMSEDKPKTAGG